MLERKRSQLVALSRAQIKLLFFFHRQAQCFLPRDKLAIRAAILQDVEELESLFSDIGRLPQVLFGKERIISKNLYNLHLFSRAMVPKSS